MALIALPGNSCKHKNALIGFIKAAPCRLGTAWVGGMQEPSAGNSCDPGPHAEVEAMKGAPDFGWG